MPYTLIKFLLWFGLAAIIGVGIGWLLRSLKARTEVADRPTGAAESEELTRLRQRLVNMEEVVEERDRLRIKVAELRRNDEPGLIGAAPEPEPEPEPNVATEPEPEPELEVVPESASDDEESVIDDSTTDDAADHDGTSDGDDPVHDAATASAVLGKDIVVDDLTVVEGIGPKISELCRGINIETWRQLADADLDELRSMLADAGPRYQLHDPTTWPHQAELLASGKWDSFKHYTDDLRSDS